MIGKITEDKTGNSVQVWESFPAKSIQTGSRQASVPGRKLINEDSSFH